MRSLRHERPPCTALSSDRTSPVATSTHIDGPEAELVAGEHDRRAIGRPCVRTLAETPRRVTVLDLLVDERLRVGSVRGGDPEVQPAGLVGQVREPRTVGREARLLHADAVAARHDLGVARTDRVPDDDASLVPRHRRDAPLVPDHPAAVGRPRRIETEVGLGTGESHRPRRTVDRCDGDVLLVDDEGHTGAVRADRRRRAAASGLLRDDLIAPYRPSAGASHSPPSIAAYTSDSPSGVQSNAPPP